MLIQTTEQLQALREELKQQSIIAFDFETTDLHHKLMQIEGLALAYDKTKVVYIPFDKTSIPQSILYSFAKELFTQPAIFVGHNLTFDLKVVKYFFNVWPDKYFDTLIAAWYLDENSPKDLKTLATKFLNKEMIKYEVVAKNRHTEEGYLEFVKYAERDALSTLELYFIFEQALKQISKDYLFYALEMPFIKVLVEMTLAGIHVNKSHLQNMELKLTEQREALLAQIYEQFNGEFNVNSSAQLSERLYGITINRKNGQVLTKKVDPDKPNPVLFTDKQAPSTSDRALQRLGTSEAKLIQQYREVEKQLTTYAIGYQKYIIDGCIWPNFNPVGCVVGDTLIPTNYGIFPIEELVDKTSLCVVNSLGEFEEVSEKFSFDAQPIINVTTNLGLTLSGTPDHPILSNKYTQEDYTRNRESCRTKGKFYQSAVWKPLNELTLIDYIKVPIGFNKFAANYKYYNGICITEELAEFLGMYFADGSIHDNNGSFTIRISNGDPEVQERVQQLSLSLFGIPAKVYKDRTTSATYITGIKLQNLLINRLELRRGAANKCVPTYILESPKTVIKAFLRGITLDSSLIQETNKVYLKISIANWKAAQAIQQILLNLGIVVSLRRGAQSKYVNSICIYNSEYSKFINEIGTIQSKKVAGYIPVTKQHHYICDSDAIWVKVKSISYDTASVYDFTVPQSHSFISNGVISHNTVTGRLSSSKPNMQNLTADKEDTPPEMSIRRAFYVPDGYNMIVADESQLELRVLAHYSKDPTLLKAFSSGGDIHAATASMVLKKPVEEITKDERRFFKTLNFAVIYGMGPTKLADMLEISEAKAKTLLQQYFSTYWKVDQFISSVEASVTKNGYVKTILGRYRRLPDVYSPDNGLKYRALRQAVNSIIQGSAADILKAAMVKIYNKFEEENLDAKILLQIHDELVIRVKEEHTDRAKEIVKECMEHPFKVDLAIPLIVEPKICKTWAEGK